MIKDISEDHTVKILITYGTLKKIIESNLLTPDEYLNLVLNGVQVSHYSITCKNEEAKDRQEREYEKTKKQILHKMETRKKKAEVRKLKPPKRKIDRGD